MEKLIARLDQAMEQATKVNFISSQIEMWENNTSVSEVFREVNIKRLKDERAREKALLSVLLDQINKMR